MDGTNHGSPQYSLLCLPYFEENCFEEDVSHHIDPQKRWRCWVLKHRAVQTIFSHRPQSNPGHFPSSTQPSQNARRLVNIKSSVSKWFTFCTIRHTEVSVVMTYVHHYIVYKCEPQLTFSKVLGKHSKDWGWGGRRPARSKWVRPSAATTMNAFTVTLLVNIQYY